MTNQEIKIKQDINFLEYPMWMQKEKKKEPHLLQWTNDAGYTVKCIYTPTKVDMLFLYYLLLESQNNNWSTTISLSRYRILKDCSCSLSKRSYSRLEESLEKWKFIGITFQGTFYDKVEYKTLSFGIINDWYIKESDNKVTIELNHFWLDKIKNSKYFKYVSFTQLKSFHSPTALRLYEILGKTFYNRQKWEIDVFKLAKKIPLTDKYLCHICPKIEKAVQIIIKRTELQITVESVKTGKNQGKFIFRRMKKSVDHYQIDTR